MHARASRADRSTSTGLAEASSCDGSPHARRVAIAAGTSSGRSAAGPAHLTAALGLDGGMLTAPGLPVGLLIAAPRPLGLLAATTAARSSDSRTLPLPASSRVGGPRLGWGRGAHRVGVSCWGWGGCLGWGCGVGWGSAQVWARARVWLAVVVEVG